MANPTALLTVDVFEAYLDLREDVSNKHTLRDYRVDGIAHLMRYCSVYQVGNLFLLLKLIKEDRRGDIN